jgi:hypothetical protein
VSQYRLYCLNEQGRFTKSHEIEARDDADALAKAREMKLPVACELWNRNRLVAELPAHS